MRIKKIFLFLAIFSSLEYPKISLAGGDSFYNAAASFVYSFPKLIINRTGPLCVYGYDQVVVAIEEKYINNIIMFKSVGDLQNFAQKNCKVLYVSKGDRGSKLAIATADKNNVASIGVYSDFMSDGGTVFLQAGRRNFELTIDQNKVKAYDIKFSPVVLGLVVR